ncbi:hypothetical protein [Spirosoma agri]|uniref:Uncharacterized protein n=1 Tax=Spirosoma agri TaxID=1987381 RepID=A0A6M0IGI8_9BACT|nr:hypothetical protein [Spirosoma agri]NEU67400.1 hypothetical protein [Spirosoma agri]
MRFFNLGYLLIIYITLTASMCGGSEDSDKAPTRSSLKIALVDSLSVDDEDDERHLTEDMRTLCDVIVSDSKDCNRTFILDPTITRLDLEKDLSLKTTIEKGGSKDVSNPKVIGRLIKKNLEELNVPKEFTKASTNRNAAQILVNFITTKASKDSILVFSVDGSLDTYLLNDKTYKVFTSIDDIRSKIQSTLCQNPKSSITLLINPPSSAPRSPLILNVSGLDCKTRKLSIRTLGGDGSPISYSAKGLSEGQSSSEFTLSANQLSGTQFTFVAKQGSSISTVKYTTICSIAPPPVKGRKGPSDNGDLTIVKGSEGCDICTRYYSATDNLGRVRQVTQRNSTECCPCGKTIEMRGRTYRMECNEGGRNRLVIAE